MRLGLFAFLFAALAGVTPARAQSSITLDAARAPIVSAEINGRPVRLEVDLRFPRGLALSEPAAAQLRVRRVPFVNAQVAIEGGGSVRARVARPRIVFEGDDVRAFAVIMPTTVTARANGVIGPGVLPHDIVTVRLRADAPNARDRVFRLDDAEAWIFAYEIGGQRVNVSFDVTNQATVLNRSAARAYDGMGAIPAAGNLAEIPLIVGLSAMMQPVTTHLHLDGIALGPAYARTNAPLLGADEADAIIVEGESDGPGPAVTIGRAALDQAGCSSISVNRRTRQLTLRCAS